MYIPICRHYELNHDFLANYSKRFLDNKLDVNVNAGVNMNERGYTRMTGQTDDLSFYSGFWDLSNGSTKQHCRKVRINAVW